MYLSKLELHGFKSFASPTLLQFDPGITAIVGPNGCGKSNIVDAVRWVIGEQRARILRSEKMENVIFNGASKRRPLGMAEVQLTVENTRGVLPTEYSEVTLGRRLYRSGESEYLLNGTPCRLRDIVDLFMDTGMGAGAYSVIELKMIEEILSDNAHDRRHLFEEAAGITKYKQRRAQALRKLDSTQIDLTRLRDLTEEIEKRVRSLKRQAAKAARYRDHEARLRRLELALAQVEYNRLTEQEQVLQAEMQQLHDVLEERSARMAKDEATMQALRKTLIDREQALSKCQQQLNEHMASVSELEAELRLNQERLDGERRDQERTTQEQEEARKHRAGLERDVKRLTGELTEAEPLQAEAERRLQKARTERDRARAASEAQHIALQKLRRKEHQTAEQRATAHRRLDRLTNRLELLDQERQRTQEQGGDLKVKIREHKKRVDPAKERLEEAVRVLETVRKALRESEQEHSSVRCRLTEATDALRQVERRHDAAAAEMHLLEGLVSSFDEFPDAVRFLAQTSSWASSELRTVADLLMCDAAHRPALDAALDDLAACLVVKTDHEAQQALSLLREEQKGRATFFVLDRLPATMSHNGSSSSPDGAVFPLRKVVQVNDPTYERLATLLLHDCYFVESLEEARQQAGSSAGPARYIAATGEWVDGRGLVHGGSEYNGDAPATSRMSRREQLDLAREHLEKLEDELARHVAVVNELQAALEAIPLQTCRQALTEAEQARAEAEREYTRLDLEVKTFARPHADLVQRLESLKADVEAGQAEIEPLRVAVDNAETTLKHLLVEREDTEEAFQRVEAESRAAQERFGEASVAAVQARNRCDNLRRDLERTRHEIQVLERRAEERQAHLETLRRTIRTAQEQGVRLQQRLGEIRVQRSDLEKGVSEAKTALLQTKVDIDQVEVRLRKLRQAREETIREENVRAIRQAEIHTRKEDLIAHVREDFGLALGVDPVEIDDPFDEAAARIDVQELRRKIKGLGNVNALALEEYEVEKERYEFMVAQQEDLESAEETLLQTIDEINTTAAARFNETYEAIRTSFQGLFTELFGQDASADLLMTDPEDALESSIDIMAKPRGKRPISITQLSSGEKTLTATALLFAIYLVKPSPFCILDEVDAPLDDANIDRFMRLIRRFADDTQFILVTHNKRTMELADRLYGITMQEHGISRLVGVKFEDALEMVG